jgi:hypothetical protein
METPALNEIALDEELIDGFNNGVAIVEGFTVQDAVKAIFCNETIV